ncbi:GGDEF domain-containing protein [Undibacterium sp. Di26W]|uniref:GGDEF domain-containing protein n=1 Tax=Undibacterium sp. Di26W TaxID=3413035 RepID=UPI003BF375DD
MVNLDRTTLDLVVVCISVISMLVMLAVWRINRGIPGTGVWAAAASVIAPAFLVTRFIGVIDVPKALIIAINNSLTLTTILLMLEGTLRFRGYPSQTRWRAGLVLIPLFVLLAFINRDDMIRRYLFHDAIAAALMLATVVILLRKTRDLELLAAGIGALSLSAMAAAFMLRWYLAFGADSNAQLASHPLLNMVYLVVVLCLLGWTYGVSVCCNLRAQNSILQMAREDVLTSLPNRRHVDEILERAIALSARNQQGFGFILIDLNHFKAVNDRHGHQVGDLLLKEVAKRLKNFCRHADFVGRIGGDEFVAITFGVNQESQLDSTLLRLKKMLVGPCAIQGHIVNIEAALGSAMYPTDGRTADRLMQAADQRMYLDKSVPDNILAAVTQRTRM